MEKDDRSGAEVIKSNEKKKRFFDRGEKRTVIKFKTMGITNM